MDNPSILNTIVGLKEVVLSYLYIMGLQWGSHMFTLKSQ